MDTTHAQSGTASAAVSARVTAWLAEHERSVRWLAAKVGMTDVTLARKLRGSSVWTVDEVAKVAEFLGTTPADLLDTPNDEHLADVGAAQPTALGVTVLFLLAVLVGWTLPTGTPVALLFAVAVAVVLVGCVRGAIAAERVAAGRGRRD